MPGIERYRRLGLCTACGKQPAPGRKKCAECLRKFNEKSKRWREKAITSGLCVMCGGANDVAGRYCSRCKARRKAERDDLKLQVYEAYGGTVCRCCGETTVEFLTLDHVNNDGAKHRRQQSGRQNGFCGQSISRWLRKNGFPPGFQVLCMNCNFARAKFGECPHERERREKQEA